MHHEKLPFYTLFLSNIGSSCREICFQLEVNKFQRQATKSTEHQAYII